MKLKRLERWSLDEGCLVGFVDEGQVSLRMRSCIGKVATTEEGTFLLGEPAPAYLAWVESKGFVFDPREPLGGLW